MSSDGGNEAATGWGNKEQIIYCQNGGVNPGTTTTQGFYRIIFSMRNSPYYADLRFNQKL